MPKTKESIAAYNKEYFARPGVKARAKVRNAARREKRKEYKKTVQGREAENRYRRKNYRLDEVKSRALFKRYGITLDDYRRMLEEQGGVCAICKKTSNKRFHVDHCHSTGRVRGILCITCNMALGLMRDDAALLHGAIEYLRK